MKKYGERAGDRKCSPPNATPAPVWPQSHSRSLQALNLPRKKSLIASERDEQARKKFRQLRGSPETFTQRRHSETHVAWTEPGCVAANIRTPASVLSAFYLRRIIAAPTLSFRRASQLDFIHWSGH